MRASPFQRLAAFLFAVLIPVSPVAKTKYPNLYPNELDGLKFYVEHLSPLRPLVSDRPLVVRVLGSDEKMELEHWYVQALFVGEGNTINGHPWAHNVTERLADLVIRPKQRVSLSAVTFPAMFEHSLGGVSEINISCDVYSDKYGLQYWLLAEDSPTGKKGDLFEIIYGPSKITQRQVIGPR